jgi:hypothetical protein
VSLGVVTAGQAKVKAASKAEKPKTLRPPTTADLCAGYSLHATKLPNVVRIQRPWFAPLQPEWAAGIENSYMVSVYRDHLGAIVTECDCAAGSHCKECRHGRLMKGIVQWIHQVRVHSTGPLDTCVLVTAWGAAADPAISFDFGVDVLIVAPLPDKSAPPGDPRRRRNEYTFVRQAGDTGPGVECDTIAQGINKIRLWGGGGK